jgi:hypothetical protein
VRYTIKDVFMHPNWFEDWWVDLPMKTKWWWMDLLFDPGTGWLKWKSDYRQQIYNDPPDIEHWVVFPPLHRAWFVLESYVRHPLDVLQRNVKWNEWPTIQDVAILKDEDRKRLFH